MQVTIRNHRMLCVFGFEPISPTAEALVSMPLLMWLRIAWRRVGAWLLEDV